MPRISGISDDTMMTHLPSLTRRFMTLYTSILAPTSIPRVGSSKMKISASVLIHLPMTTFCWLPPDSCPTISSMEGVLMRRDSMFSVPFSRMRFWFRNIPSENPFRLARIRLLRMDSARTRPCPFLSSVRNAMPALMAWPGFLIVTSLPSI